MRLIYFIICLLLSVALIVVLNKPFGTAPPIGAFISPQHGFWQNAEPVDQNFTEDLEFPQLKKNTEVYFDERMVPHIFAEEDNDVYFVQGYLHARFRLWQMEFQTHAAAGRLTEILGPGPDSAYLNNDRMMRRLGVVYGAKKSLTKMEKDAQTRNQMNAYTAGVNAYIGQLTVSSLPVEYRLLNYYPEKWTNLKTALFLKYMSFELTGYDTDIEYTNAKSFFSEEDFNKLYPVFPDSLDPVIPKGTVFPAPAVQSVMPASADSLYFRWKHSVAVETIKTDKDNGSNNWAVSGSKTKSGKPILCSDPHLGLSLPALWYEMHVQTPSMNVYGVSFPGSPAIIIGFNDSIAWGVTNAARDVRDYYSIQFKDQTRAAYRFNNEWKNAELKVEAYTMKDGSVFYDTVAYTIFGPVMYDDHYNGRGRTKNTSNLAVQWSAHDPSNELKTFIDLNSAKNYNDYETALKNYWCPGQNILFAAKNGDIAIRQQGAFPAKWKRQGDFIMPGTDSSYMWQTEIPFEENPFSFNPERGFASSANQCPADSAYPYYLGGHYDLYRGVAINRFLSGMSEITPTDMQRLQTENYNVFAETALPFLLSRIHEEKLSAEEKKYLDIVRQWNLRNDQEEKGATIFVHWFEKLEESVWNDELSGQPAPTVRPESYTLIEALKRDTAFSFVDNILTPEKETVEDVITESFKRTIPVLRVADEQDKLAWGKDKNTGIRHLLRLEPFSRFHLNNGGGYHVINATKQFHGPSWRMVVHLDDVTEAYGIYAGGQSGNPGSPYYDDFVNDWTEGKYNRLWVMKKEDHQNKRIRAVMKFSKPVSL